MIIKGTLEYELKIAEKDGHGVVYKSDLDGEIASLLIAAEVLQARIDSAKEYKKDPKITKKYKDILGSQISAMNKGVTAINNISMLLLETYQEYKESIKIQE